MSSSSYVVTMQIEMVIVAETEDEAKKVATRKGRVLPHVAKLSVVSVAKEQ